MAVRQPNRIELRVSDEDRKFFDKEVCGQGETISSWVRARVAEAREAAALADRLAAVEEIVQMSGDWGAGDWDELEKQLDVHRFGDAW